MQWWGVEGGRGEVFKSEYPSFLAGWYQPRGPLNFAIVVGLIRTVSKRTLGTFFETAWSVCGCSRVHNYVTVAIGSLCEGPSVQVSLVQDGLIYSLG